VPEIDMPTSLAPPAIGAGIRHACRLHNGGSKRDHQPMSPPTEQLIRDYLNRLSVAARGQLGPDDRRALVNRTRDFVERKTGLAGPPTAMEVARLLAGLGDPSGLVQQERQRLAAVRGELPEPAANRNRIARVLRRDATRARTASWHWPVQEGRRVDLQLTLLEGGATLVDVPADADVPASPSPAIETTSAGTTGAAPGAAGTNAPDAPDVPDVPDVRAGSNGIARNGVARDLAPTGADEPAAHVPAQASEPSWFMQALGGHEPDATDQPDDAPAAPDLPPAVPAKRRWPSASASTDGGTRRLVISDSTMSGDSVNDDAGPAWQLTTLRDSVVSRQARRALTAVVAWYRRRPLEASAVVLLGLGGVIYPPAWLLGAGVALASRLWDYRDKWTGLALPLLVTLIAAAVGFANGSHVSVGQGVHEGWVYGVVTSRLAAALSATYLGWRSVHGRRPPAVPPWNKPHKIG
jgi:hypothetical protein